MHKEAKNRADGTLTPAVRRYAHLAPNHLTEHAMKIDELMSHDDINMSHQLLEVVK